MILNSAMMVDCLVNGFFVFSLVFLVFCSVVLFLSREKYKTTTEQIKGQFVDWQKITVNPTRAIDCYYPIFRYEYKGEIYENRSIKGWRDKIPTLYCKEYPIWINPKNPDIMSVHLEEYKDFDFTKL